MKKRILTALLCVVLILTCLTACGGNKATDGNVSDSNIIEEDTGFFSGFVTTDIDGNKHTQKALKGNKVTMVNIWGTFCSPCINEMPDLEKISKDYADKGLVVIGIVSDTYDYFKDENNEDKIVKAKNIIEMTGVTYTNLLPSESLNKVRLDYVSTYPTTYFLDEDGELLGECVGSRSYEQWATIIDSMLEIA